MGEYYLTEDEVFNELKDQKNQKRYHALYSAFTNNGFAEYLPNRVPVQDLISSPDLMRFVPTVVEHIVREALEPALLVIPNAFQEIRLERGRTVQIGAIGALTAARIPEGTEYPERLLQMDGGDMVAFSVGKRGLRISITEEAENDIDYDIIGLWLRAAGRALARHKEAEAVRLLDAFGVTVLDNATPATATGLEGGGTCQGRDITGAQNGSMTVNDIMEMYTYGAVRGFTYDTLLMNPLAWKTFMTDSEMREVVIQGGTIASARMPGGGPSSAWGTSHQGFGLRTTATGTPGQPWNRPGNAEKIGAEPWVQTLNPLAATYTIAPRYLPSPLQVIVTPLLRFRDSAGAASTAASGEDTTDIVMLDSNNAGVLITRDPVSTEEWDDPHRDIRNIKLKERYGFALLEQGKGVAVARDVVIARNYVFDNVNSVTLDAITRTTALAQVN